MSRLFGTDGVRGIAYEFLNRELATNIGKALGYILNKDDAKILIGCDTRESGKMITDALCEGLCAYGCSCFTTGTVSTPAIAYLTKSYGFDAGIMVTASHNPYEYNGIKIFGKDGFKLSDEKEDEIESLISSEKLTAPEGKTGKVIHNEELKKEYSDYLISAGASLSGIRAVIDCANGSACSTAQEIFTALGADCEFIGISPDGKNVNKDCGSTHLDKLKAHMAEGNFDIGIAFDGDADRCLAIDEMGNEIDGDHILAILSVNMKRKGKLNSDTVVGTVMANCGFSKFCSDNGIRFIPTKVGDRYVLEEMERGSYSLGGEQSGHIIIRELATTGDGQLTAIMLMAAMKESGLPLSKLAAICKKYPQYMVNVNATASQKAALATDKRILNIINNANIELSSSGRLLVRASGTEPLIRIMVESDNEERTKALCCKIASDIKECLSEY